LEGFLVEIRGIFGIETAKCAAPGAIICLEDFWLKYSNSFQDGQAILHEEILVFAEESLAPV
jgi:hypothetical protein